MLSSFAFPEPQLKTTTTTDVHKKKNNSKNNNNNNNNNNEDTASVHELTALIGRLTAQLEKLETIKAEKKLPSNSSNAEQQQEQQQHQQPLAENSKRIIINPLAADVTQAYEKLIQQSEHLQSSSSSSLAHNSNNNSNHCCCSCSPTPPASLSEEAITVEAAPGIPWFTPYTITSTTTSNGTLSNRSNTSTFMNNTNDDSLQAAYTHWCTLMRCLPSMDSTAQSYVRTIGHYAMRQLLHSMRNNSNNSAPATGRYSSLMSSPPIQRHSHYHGSSATLLSSKTAGMASIHAGSSNTGSTTLAQHPLLKTSSTCLNDVHPPSTHYSLSQENTSLCKADAWVPPRMMDDNSALLHPHQHHNHHHSHHHQNNNHLHQQQHNNSHPPLHQQQGHPYSRIVHQQQQQQEDQNARTPPVANSGSSPLPTSNSLFSSPLMQHISRPYHAAKLRRWFKRHNKVAPVDGQH